MTNLAELGSGVWIGIDMVAIGRTEAGKDPHAKAIATKGTGQEAETAQGSGTGTVVIGIEAIIILVQVMYHHQDMALHHPHTAA